MINARTVLWTILLITLKKYSTIIHFSDLFHLTKRDRYKKASAENFFIPPMKPDIKRCASDLEEVGDPQYLLDHNKGRKMEDMLPKKLFSMQTIIKTMEKGDIHLLISMLPSTLHLESIHRRELSIQATINYLLFGASIMMIYYFLLMYVIENEFDIYSESPTSYRSNICFSAAWCKQYIFTANGITSTIITEEKVDVGACSSHYQEHGFANIRRHPKNDNSHMPNIFLTGFRFKLYDGRKKYLTLIYSVDILNLLEARIAKIKQTFSFL